MSIKFTILGCGSSLGVPRIDGYFGKCNPKIKKNIRTRSSALININNYNILFDTSPDLKAQLILNKVKDINKVFYTHSHADQTHGINELRVFYLKNKKKIPLYADNVTKKYLLKSFKYCFTNTDHYPATLKMNSLKKIHKYNFEGKGILIRCIPVQHGYIKSMSYIVNNTCAYAPDIKKINSNDLKYFKNLKFFIVDCLRYEPHPSHFNLDDVLKLVKTIKPKKTILTNLNNEIDYLQIKKQLPKGMVPAYDGMSFLI